jgi:hypothetical protein
MWSGPREGATSTGNPTALEEAPHVPYSLPATRCATDLSDVGWRLLRSLCCCHPLNRAGAPAAEIDRSPEWRAWAEEEPFLNAGRRLWWVKAHHDAMRATPTNPYPVSLIAGHADWEFARDRWK